MANQRLTAARNNKNDEFYTSLKDIENELKHYGTYFEDKIVLCNCDDPSVSNFFHYFFHNFDRLKLKKLIAVCYKNQNLTMFSDNKSQQAIYLVYEGNEENKRMPNIEDIEIKFLKGNGDFRTPECVDLLKQSDIICTNPPFSLWQEYFLQLIKYGKSFLIIGDTNKMFLKKVFPYIINRTVWIGWNSNMVCDFQIPDDYKSYSKMENGIKYATLPAICWFTNLSHNKSNKDLILTKKYYGNEKDYPNYDLLQNGHDAINVDKLADIPKDYYGPMGVPQTFLINWNPEQFEALGSHDKPEINGKSKFTRVLIRRK